MSEMAFIASAVLDVACAYGTVCYHGSVVYSPNGLDFPEAVQDDASANLIFGAIAVHST